MLAARDQENLAFNCRHNAAVKQQQGQAKLQSNTPGARFAKTPLKVPLNDENTTHVAGGAKSILGARTRGNENTLNSKGKGLSKSNLATPSEAEPRSRAPLGDKTTNAKAKGQRTTNVKSAVREIEKSQTKLPTTTRPKHKYPFADQLYKLDIHSEESDPLGDGGFEYGPPGAPGSPYKSEIFPDSALKVDALDPDNLFKGYYDYYHNPVDEHGVPIADQELQERIRKAMDACDKQIKEDMDKFEWRSIQKELNAKKNPSASAKATPNPDMDKKRPARDTSSSRYNPKKISNDLSMDDTTKSMQRKAIRPVEPSRDQIKRVTTRIPHPSTSKFGAQSLTQAIPRKTSMEIETNSRTTIGFSKGRDTAVVLAQERAEEPCGLEPRTESTLTDTTFSNGSDETITPARYAHTEVSSAAEIAAEDEEWKERVPFLSIFRPRIELFENEDEFEFKAPHAEDEDFEFKLSE